MTDLVDVLRELDPVPELPRYDDDVAARTVARILTGSRPPRPAASTATVAPRAVSTTTDRARRRPTGRQFAVGAATLVVVAAVALSVAVAVGLLRPLAPTAPAARGVDALFGPDIDPRSISQQAVVGSASGPLTLWVGHSAALGDCLAVTADGSSWSAAPSVDRGWRPIGSGAACADVRIDLQRFGAGFIARFTRDGGAEQVFAGRVTAPEAPSDGYTPDNGPTGGVTRSVEITPAGGAAAPAEIVDGVFLTPPVATGSCATVVARNGAGSTLTTDAVDPDCAGPIAPAVDGGSSRAEIVANTTSYPDDLTVGLSALTKPDPAVTGVRLDAGVTLVTLSVQFFDSCPTLAGPVGSRPPITADACYRTTVPMPTDVDLQLLYGAGRTPATPEAGVPGPANDLTSPPTPGYVGGKIFGLVVYRSFAVPTDQLGALTARWSGDARHAPLLMPDAQTALR